MGNYYARYIYKNGVKLGPYYYSNKKVNGKVISTYLGTKEPTRFNFKVNPNNKKIIIVILSLFSVALLIYISMNIGLFGTGKSIVNPETTGIIGSVPGDEIVPAEEIIPVEEINDSNLSARDIGIDKIKEVEEVPEIITEQKQATINSKVEWSKEVNLNKEGPARVQIPFQATDIVVYSVDEQGNKNEVSDTNVGVTAQASSEIVLEKSESPIVSFFKKIFNFLTGNVVTVSEIGGVKEVVINENKNKYEVQYKTPGPTVTEEEINNGKRVAINSPPGLQYNDVVVYTNIESLGISDPGSIRIYWVEQNEYIDYTNIDDTNADGILDYLEWISPSADNQTYEIIVITRAEHLDSNRNFISDVYEKVVALDDIFTEEIPNGDYVRVTFEKNLTSENDITIYPRITSGSPKIEVYEKDGNEVIAEFSNIIDNEYNKILLTNLIGKQDTFDLKIIGGSVEFDYIVDPPIQQYTGGLLVYANGVAGTPAYRVFDDTTGFGVAQSASSVGASAINWIRVAASPVNDEWIIATRDAANVIKAQVCTGTDIGVSCGSATTITSTAGTHGFRNFDIAYEQLSGDALLVYGTATPDELRKIEYINGVWINDATITTTRTIGTVEWVELTSRSNSDQIGIAYSDSNDAVGAYRWSGIAVANEATAMITATASTGNVRKFDVSFEGTSGDMLVASPTTAVAGTIAYGALSGAAWTITTSTLPDNLISYFDMQEPGADNDIAMAGHGITFGGANPVEGYEWSGSLIVDGNVAVDTATTNWVASYQMISIAYVSPTYYSTGVFSDANDDINWWTMNSGGTWTARTDNLRTRGIIRFIDVFDYPNVNKVLLISSDANGDLWADTWDGVAISSTAWVDLTSGGTLEGFLSSATTKVFDFAFRLAPVIVPNQPPVIDLVNAIPDVTPIEANIKPVTFNVQVSDPDGYTDISSVTAEFSYAGEPTRSGSCILQSGAGNTATYTCTVNMQYYDKGAVSWNVLITATDSLAQVDTDNTRSFVYLELKAMVINSPVSLSWPTLNPGSSTPVSSINNPNVIRNTGNYEAGVGGVSIIARDLVGETNPLENIPASNFRAGPTLGLECTATQLQNALVIPITNSILPRASDLGISTEEIYYCITSVPYVSSQAYSATGLNSWRIEI